MMHLRGLVLLLLCLAAGARRSMRINDAHQDAQQQNTLANGLEVSADSREAFIPGGSFRFAGPRAGVSRVVSEAYNPGRTEERVAKLQDFLITSSPFANLAISAPEANELRNQGSDVSMMAAKQAIKKVAPKKSAKPKQAIKKVVPKRASAALLESGPAPKCGPKVSRPISPTKTAAFDSALARGSAVPAVILCRPFDAGNVGGAARAMLNFGLWDLRVVDPHDAQVLSSDEAILRASGAAPVLQRASTHQSLGSAVADLQLVLATTARPRESRIPVRTPREAVARAAAAIQRGERVGLLFGSEKNGLSNAELESATEIVTIDTMPGFSSLNLAQAVLLMCYEWGTNQPADGSPPTAGVVDEAQRAPLSQLDSLFAFWERSLWESSFFGGGRAVRSTYGADEGAKQERSRATAAMNKLRRLVLRGEPTKSEASLLRGSLQSLAGQYGSGSHTEGQPQLDDATEAAQLTGGAEA